MALRQYIGARYVTKIYENSLDPSSAEWEAGVTYEPLTMVTYLNSSYLSKKDVPGSIGDPASNPSYWVVTGAYNGQILNLQNQIDTINNVDIPAIMAAIANIESEDLSDRKFILIADSYGGQPTESDAWTTLTQAALTNLGATCYKAYGNGAGFSTTLKFSDVLATLQGNVGDPDDITDIIVMGGVNEYGNTYNDILSGYQTFLTYCATEYPNAHTYVGTCSLNGLGIEGLIIYSIANSYKTMIKEAGGKYMTNSELAFHNYAGLGGDHSHPNLLGSQIISDFLMNYILNGEVDTTYCTATPTVTMNAATMSSLNLTITEYRNLQTITAKISLSDGAFLTAAPLSTPVKIASIGWDGFIFGETPINTNLKCRLVKDDNTLINDQTISLYIDHGDIYLAGFNNVDNIKALYGADIIITLTPALA